MSRPHRQWHPALLTQALVALMALGCGCSALAAQGSPEAGGTATAPATWVPHKYRFHFMGFTSTYSCIGLMHKLRLVLQTSGARVQQLTPLCSVGYDRPDRLAEVEIRFETLKPEAAPSDGSAARASPVGRWRRVQLAPHRPYDLQDGDCELVDQFRSALLPMFAARDVHANMNCVPHQDMGPFALTFEVFAPAG